jgi:polyisoprenoid-binding protein YceI
MKKIAFALSTLFILCAFTFTHIDTYKANIKTSNLIWHGEKLKAKHFGHIQLKSGELKINHGKLVGAEFVIDMRSITNKDIDSKKYKAMLIDDLKSNRFFDVENYPEAFFKLIRATPLGGNKFDILGQLNIKGNLGPVSIPLELKYEDNGNVTAIGECSINRTKFGLTYGSNSFFDNLGDEAISDLIRLEFNIVLEK